MACAASARRGCAAAAAPSPPPAALSTSTRSPAASCSPPSGVTASRRRRRTPTTPRGSCAARCPAARSRRGRPPRRRRARDRRGRRRAGGAWDGRAPSPGARSTRSRRCGCSATCCSWSRSGRDTLPRMTQPFRIVDLGDRRVLETGGRAYPTRYSARVIRLLVDRKGAHRAPLYFDFKDTRGPLFLGPLFAYLRTRGARGLRVLEVGCSFGHMTEYLAEQPEAAVISTFDTDAAFVELTRAKVEELDLGAVREVRHLDQAATCRLPWADGAFDLVVAVGIVEHLPVRHRRRQVDEWYRVLAPGGHIAVLDTPNRWFPLETHSVGLPPA